MINITPDVCPLCSKPLLNPHGIQQAGKRICCLCGGKIKKIHRWRIGSTGVLEHRDCRNPTASKPSQESKGLF